MDQISSIFKPASHDEITNRAQQQLKMLADELTSRKDCIKNPDGSYSFIYSVALCSMNLTQFPIKFKHVGGHFICFHNKLTSLDGAPGSVVGNFDCSFNQLTTLEGAPVHVGGSFNCTRNKLTSLSGSPKSVGAYFYCKHNPVEFTRKDAPHMKVDKFLGVDLIKKLYPKKAWYISHEHIPSSNT
jgi:hypothetical protein